MFCFSDYCLLKVSKLIYREKLINNFIKFIAPSPTLNSSCRKKIETKWSTELLHRCRGLIQNPTKNRRQRFLQEQPSALNRWLFSQVPPFQTAGHGSAGLSIYPRMLSSMNFFCQTRCHLPIYNLPNDVQTTLRTLFNATKPSLNKSILAENKHNSHNSHNSHIHILVFNKNMSTISDIDGKTLQYGQLTWY